MRRGGIALLAILIIITAAGCAKAQSPLGHGKISVVCTVFPQYDWARQIIGGEADNIKLSLLLNNNIDLHSYQPSVDDIITISTCDLFIFIGGESDGWVNGVLNQAANADMIVINLLETLGGAAKLEEITEGMEAPGEDDDFDEHVWLSLKNAAVFSTAITEALSYLDAAHADKYRNNLSAYIGKLTALDDGYRAAVEAAPVKTLLFGDRFPFRYLTDDYGIDYFAAFPGCSAETEASFNTIIFLAEKADEYALSAVMVTESANQSIARAIIANTESKHQRILVLDSMQSVTLSAVAGGAAYLPVMESNLEILKEALR